MASVDSFEGGRSQTALDAPATDRVDEVGVGAVLEQQLHAFRASANDRLEHRALLPLVARVEVGPLQHEPARARSVVAHAAQKQSRAAVLKERGREAARADGTTRLYEIC